MKGLGLFCAAMAALMVCACGGGNTGKKVTATNATVKIAAPAKNENAITGYKDINWGDNKDKVMSKYSLDPNYSVEWNNIGKIPFVHLKMRDANSPIDDVKIYFYKDQAQQISILYKYKPAHTVELFRDLTARYDGYGLKHTDQRTGPIVGTVQGTKFTRKWVDKNTIVHMDYFKDYEKNQFIWIGNFTLLSVRLIQQELDDQKAVRHDE